MKIKFFVALATLIIIFLSCNWFRNDKNQMSNPLIGEWRLDSVQKGNDTLKASFLTAAVPKGSGDIHFSFTNNFIFAHSNGVVDTTEYSFDRKSNLLKVNDSANQTLTFVKINDSLITLVSKDSSVFFLQKN